MPEKKLEFKETTSFNYEKHYKELSETFNALERNFGVVVKALLALSLVLLITIGSIVALAKYAGREMSWAALNKKEVNYAIVGKEEMEKKIASASAKARTEYTQKYYEGFAAIFVEE